MTARGRFEPTTPQRLPELLARSLADRAPAPVHPHRVAVDGPAAADPAELAEAIAGHLRGTGRPATVIMASSFWRDASLRLEFGREDVDAFARDWLDVAALAREVLDPLGPDGTRSFLPALRDPVSNRSRRAPYRTAAPDETVMIAGELLLGRGLAFDTTIHLAMSPSARRRHTAAPQQWTLTAHDRYDTEVDPGTIADFVVSWNDPNRPALQRR